MLCLGLCQDYMTCLNFRSSVMFNPIDTEGGLMRYQTNSMSFYQKMNIRQNSIEGKSLYILIIPLRILVISKLVSKNRT